LNHANIGAVLEHVRCRAVPECVRIDSLDAGQAAPFADGPGNRPLVDSPVPACDMATCSAGPNFRTLDFPDALDIVESALSV
jgi:hypothetical protein